RISCLPFPPVPASSGRWCSTTRALRQAPRCAIFLEWQGAAALLAVPCLPVGGDDHATHRARAPVPRIAHHSQSRDNLRMAIIAEARGVAREADGGSNRDGPSDQERPTRRHHPKRASQRVSAARLSLG